jgi:hypothetical protein
MSDIEQTRRPPRIYDSSCARLNHKNSKIVWDRWKPKRKLRIRAPTDAKQPDVCVDFSHQAMSPKRKELS